MRAASRGVDHLFTVAFPDASVDEADDKAQHGEEEPHHEENTPVESRRRTGADALFSHNALRPGDRRKEQKRAGEYEGQVGLSHCRKV